MDGISGIKIYNQLSIDTDFLPEAYGSTLTFIVVGISHKLQNNDWVTEITASPIPKTNFTSVKARTGKQRANKARVITLPPAAVPNTIQNATPGAKTVILSTGLSNNMTDLANIEKQFKFLKDKGCKVFVIGVTNDPPTTPYDLRPILQSSIKLQKLTQDYGFTYCGDFTPSSDKVHPNYGPYFDSNVKPKLGTAIVDIIVGDSIATGIANAKFGTSRTSTNRVKASKESQW